MPLTVITKTADILGEPQTPDMISNNDSQLLYGEKFEVEKEHGAYVYGRSVIDGYVGFVERDQLAKNVQNASHVVSVRASHLYREPTFKSRPITKISFLSHLAIKNERQNGFTQTQEGVWIFADHIAPINNLKITEDLAQTATIFLGAPYLYAGRSTFGIDCSGLVQQSMMAQGHPCPPRDSSDQQDKLGNVNADTQLQRNDIVYFKGHVGIMMDDSYIINATARHMSTVIEHINDLKSAYGEILKVARL